MSRANREADRAVLSVRFDGEGGGIAIYVSDSSKARLITGKLQKEFEIVRPYPEPYLPIHRADILEEPRSEQ